MPSTYCEIYFHLVWATKGREPWISEEMEGYLYAFIRHKCAELGVHVYAVNGVEDHVHLVVSVPPRLAVAQLVHDVKGSSSYFINHRPDQPERLYWQEGYGALTFAHRDLARIRAYVENQKQHHLEGSLSPRMERCEGDPPVASLSTGRE